jgi:hypothetical protein
MRAHGVPNFPDPTVGPGGQGLSVTGTPGSSIISINGINFSGPAFEHAKRACNFGPAQGGPVSIPESQRERMLAIARCLRTHGVPNFADPNFNDIHPATAGSKEASQLPGPSPALQQATKICLAGRRRIAAP